LQASKQVLGVSSKIYCFFTGYIATNTEYHLHTSVYEEENPTVNPFAHLRTIFNTLKMSETKNVFNPRVRNILGKLAREHLDEQANSRWNRGSFTHSTLIPGSPHQHKTNNQYKQKNHHDKPPAYDTLFEEENTSTTSSNANLLPSTAKPTGYTVSVKNNVLHCTVFTKKKDKK